MGILYIVATPIGNLEDVTLRAIKVISDADIVLAEDTRVTQKLLDFLRKQNLNPTNNVLSYHQHSQETRKYEILKYLLEGKNIALVTDAGTPGISDPGNELIDFILTNEPSIKIVPVPGPSAITTALSVAGFDLNKFVFLGLIPKKGKEKLFKWIKEGEVGFAFYESPNRILKTLILLEKEFGSDKRVFVGRELTKLYETLYRGTISSVLKELEKSSIKGELVVVVE